MLFLESDEYSDFKNSSMRDLTRIYSGILEEEVFRNNYDELLNHIIMGLNSQAAIYIPATKSAVRKDSLDLILDVYLPGEMEEYQKALKENIQNNRPPTFSEKYENLPPFPELELEFDDDAIINLYEASPKKFEKYQRKAFSALSNFVEDIDTLEETATNYRTRLVQTLKNNIPYLLELHYAYVYDVKNKKEDIKNEKFVDVDGVSIRLYASQKEFLTNAIKTLVGSL
jgi:hypothetical protein